MMQLQLRNTGLQHVGGKVSCGRQHGKPTVSTKPHQIQLCELMTIKAIVRSEDTSDSTIHIHHRANARGWNYQLRIN
jgi:hypothetical protein